MDSQMIFKPRHQGGRGLAAMFLASETVTRAFDDHQLGLHAVALEGFMDQLAVVEIHQRISVSVNQ